MGAAGDKSLNKRKKFFSDKSIFFVTDLQRFDNKDVQSVGRV